MCLWHLQLNADVKPPEARWWVLGLYNDDIASAIFWHERSQLITVAPYLLSVVSVGSRKD